MGDEEAVRCKSCVSDVVTHLIEQVTQLVCGDFPCLEVLDGSFAGVAPVLSVDPRLPINEGVVAADV